ncbi:DUF3703 domain-containing protein [Polaromonas naphthalenivorans]|uniref:YtkA-like domain-containing protein n=1 Tax=Polaromonas naphthalenivorans (strain CJ2) TaxID=365044 RepID=A1VWA5_POLNA|nr:DUF3703 domain-containing protein [Polaromonas naphthalenivorans]ABM39933.1 hypothetical protein Pnap_4869 [Polaromonas naphthalenivorans CJ2]
MTTFAIRIKPSVQREIAAADAAQARGHFSTSFEHLERAHVLGQAATAEHVRVHWHMLRFALRNSLHGEAFGQLWRLVAASIFTAPGLVPEGNTGGADVSGFRRMPIAQDLQQALNAARAPHTPAPKKIMLRMLTAAAALAALATLMTGCVTQPKDLDLSLEKNSVSNVYRVALVPPAQAPAINQMHSWKVKLAAPDGTPVHGAKFAVDGGMPQHGHGLPTQPRVTREVENGTYALDGMKFSMTGWWEVKLAIQGPQGADQVTFNWVVNNPAVQTVSLQ